MNHDDASVARSVTHSTHFGVLFEEADSKFGECELVVARLPRPVRQWPGVAPATSALHHLHAALTAAEPAPAGEWVWVSARVSVSVCECEGS